jgi:hypothetical protein
MADDQKPDHSIASLSFKQESHATSLVVTGYGAAAVFRMEAAGVLPAAQSV